MRLRSINVYLSCSVREHVEYLEVPFLLRCVLRASVLFAMLPDNMHALLLIAVGMVYSHHTGCLIRESVLPYITRSRISAQRAQREWPCYS